jgi:hypothetical protein
MIWALLNSPFIQVALPVVMTVSAAEWLNGKRLNKLRSEMHRQFDTVELRFDGIDSRFDALDLRFDGMERRFRDAAAVDFIEYN